MEEEEEEEEGEKEHSIRTCIILALRMFCPNREICDSIGENTTCMQITWSAYILPGLNVVVFACFGTQE